MKKPKQDRRVARTRAALRAALKELTAEQGYEAVTVENITERANIGRTTFYQHYRDKEDLFLESFETRLTALIEEITSQPLLDWFMENNGAVVRSIFDTVQENAEIFRVVTRENSNNVYNRFREIIVKASNQLVDDAQQRHGRHPQPAVPLDYLVNFYSGAIWASIVWWVENDFTPPAAEMTRYFRLIFFPGLIQGLGVTDHLLR